MQLLCPPLADKQTSGSVGGSLLTTQSEVVVVCVVIKHVVPDVCSVSVIVFTENTPTNLFEVKFQLFQPEYTRRIYMCAHHVLHVLAFAAYHIFDGQTDRDTTNRYTRPTHSHIREIIYVQ